MRSGARRSSARGGNSSSSTTAARGRGTRAPSIIISAEFGESEIGDRWVREMRRGRVHSDYMNNIGLGICLVGDFNRDQPTKAQLEACEELIRYLRERCGKMTVRPHREVNPPRWATDCPGDVFPY